MLAEEVETRRGKETSPFLSASKGPNRLPGKAEIQPCCRVFVVMPHGWVFGSGFRVLSWTLFFGV